MQQKFPQMPDTTGPDCEPVWTSPDGSRFGWREWGPDRAERGLVVGLHGLNLRATDFSPLGETLATAGIRTAAWNLRGQGLDPVRHRRGSWLDPSGIQADLEAFIEFVRRDRPTVPLFLAGDSMGALLALHAAANGKLAHELAGVLLFVPVVDLAQRNPPWVRTTIDLLAWTVPALRLNPGWFVHGKTEVPLLTRIPERQHAVETAPHRVDAFTVRFLAAMGALIAASQPLARTLTRPVAVFSAGHDIFVTPDQTEAFFACLSAEDRTHFHYASAYHQLLFDLDRERVLADALHWIEARLAPLIQKF